MRRLAAGTRRQEVDVGVLAATHQALRAQVSAGRFREDLMYRVRVVTRYLPTLTERTGDIHALVWHFVDEFNGKARAWGGRQIREITAAALDAMAAYPWLGNIRELRNVIEQACALGEGPTLTLADLTPELRGEGPARRATRVRTGQAPAPPSSPVLPLAGAPDDAAPIRAALAETGGREAEAARLLGISRPPCGGVCGSSASDCRGISLAVSERANGCEQDRSLPCHLVEVYRVLGLVGIQVDLDIEHPHRQAQPEVRPAALGPLGVRQELVGVFSVDHHGGDVAGSDRVHRLDPLQHTRKNPGQSRLQCPSEGRPERWSHRVCGVRRPAQRKHGLPKDEQPPLPLPGHHSDLLLGKGDAGGLVDCLGPALHAGPLPCRPRPRVQRWATLWAWRCRA